MQINSATLQNLLSRDLTDFIIRLGLIAFLVVICVRVFTPFAGLVLWGLILAVALYPLYQRIVKILKGREGRAATLLVVAGLLLIGIPTLMLGSSFAGQIHDAYSAVEKNKIHIEQPDPSVAEWPLIGKKLHKAWSSAANNLPAFLTKIQPQLKQVSKYVLSVAANTAGGVFLFLGALIIAGIMLAYGESGSRAMLRILNRLTGPSKGPQLLKLSSATIRSVAMGVIGVAFLQALLLGIGFIMADIPAAGVLALIVMLLGILQLPAVIISLPVIAYIWWTGDAGTTMNIVYTVYLLVAGMADNILKPILLGRGVDAPMPIILLGALGGMVASGIIGLFVGAVFLAVGYQIFMDWVDDDETVANPAPQDPEDAAQTPPAGA